MFDKAALFAALKPKTSKVTIDGFGELTLRQLSVAEVESVRAKLKDDKESNRFGIGMVVMSVIDDDGVAVFSDADVPELIASGNAAIDILVSQTLTLNGFIKAEAKN